MVAARGPLALATHLRGITEFLTDIKIEPENSHKLLDICTKTVISWLKAQAENLPDVESILVLDDIVGLMSPADYEGFAHPYLERVFAAFPGMLKVYHNDANVEPFAERLAETGFDVLNFSHNIDISKLAGRIGHRIALMGNVPPLQVLVEGTPEEVAASTQKCLDSGCKRLIVSAGGGMSPGTPAQNIEALVKTVKQF
jgi:uroporphyrinogen decarboxylase